MFILIAISPIAGAIGLTGLSGLLSLLSGGGPSFEDAINAVQNNPAFKPKIPPLPQGGFTAGGGSFNQGFDKFVDFSSKKNMIDNILSGKGKHSQLEKNNPDLFKYFKEGGDISKVPAGLLIDSPGILAKGHKLPAVPTQDVQSNPTSSNIFDLSQLLNMFNAQSQLGINQALTSSVVPNQINFMNNSISAANKAIPYLFETTPEQQSSIDKEATNFFTRGSNQISDAFKAITDNVDQDLITNGAFFSSDLQDLRGQSKKKLADSLEDLSLQTEGLRRDEIDRALAANRAGVSTLYGSPSFLSGISNFNLPQDTTNPLSFQPFGNFGQGDILFNQLNTQNQYGLNASQMKMAPLLAALSPAFSLSSQPGIAQGVGGTIGSIAPLLLLQGLIGKK